MKSFRTELPIFPSAHFIKLSTPIMTMGSCFSDVMGERLGRNKFNIAGNPLGVTYDPISIHRVLSYAVLNEPPRPETYLQNNGLWSNYDFHSSFSARTRGEVQEKIVNALGLTHYFLKEARFLIITYGSAWVFERMDTGERVANCHKMPASGFVKKLLSVEEICSSFVELYRVLKSFQPGLKIILTVSPVRHTKDTLELNSVGKAVLRLAVHQLLRHADLEYFPAYELMMDDLRDYRFYAADMLHPSDEAITYLWEKFSKKYFDQETLHFIHQWQSISASLHHTPFHPGSESHQKFLQDALQKLEVLTLQIDAREEISFVRSQMQNPDRPA